MTSAIKFGCFFMVKSWCFAWHQSHDKCALCGTKKNKGLANITNQVVKSVFKYHSILLAWDARVCSHHFTQSGCVEDTITSSLNGLYFAASSSSSARRCTKDCSTGKKENVEKVWKKPHQIRAHLLSFEDTDLTFSKGHIESFTILQENIKESSHNIHTHCKIHHRCWKRMCAD